MDGYVAKPILAADLFREMAAVLSATAAVDLDKPARGQIARESRAAGAPHRRPAIIDAAQVFERVDNDGALLAELVSLFRADYPRLRGDIESALAAKDASRLRAAAHALKGAVGNFSAQEAHERAKALEDAARDDDLRDAPAIYATLARAMERLEPELARLVSPFRATSREASE
jgi:protein-histidine pros-kinase